MTKLIALAAAGMFVAGTAFAGQHGDCVKQVGNKDKMACEVSLANLNLTAEQKTKMDAAIAEHHKEGCNATTEAKYEQTAKSVLTKEQFAKFKAEEKGEKEKTQS
jgi:Spy/CpxP family protein refolding chaperone